MSEPLIRTNIKDTYLISTIHRQSSLPSGEWFYETIIFRFKDHELKHREIVEQYDSGSDEGLAIIRHIGLIDHVYEKYILKVR